MKRFSLTSFVILWPLTVGAQITLAPNPVVEGKKVILSDIFLGLKKYKKRVVGDAPKPGKSYKLGVKNLRKLANQYDLDWSPESIRDSVEIKRASQMPTREDIMMTLKSALREMVTHEDYDITLNGNDLNIHLAADEPLNIQVEDLKLNTNQNRYTARIKAGSQKIRVNGKIQHLLRIPVLAQNKMRGDVIGEEDLIWIKIPSSQINPTVLIHEESLIGASPKLVTLRANVPIRKYDIEIPKAVKRGQMVSIVVRSPFLTLQTQGKAKDNGVLGDVVRVVNLESNTVLQGQVVGRNRVEIASATTIGKGV